MFFVYLYLLSLVFSGWANWITRKTQIRTRLDLIVATMCMLCPIVNFLTSMGALESHGWFKEPINWD